MRTLVGADEPEPEYATGGLIPPGSMLIVGGGGCTVPPTATTNVTTVTIQIGGMDEQLQHLVRRAIRSRPPEAWA